MTPVAAVTYPSVLRSQDMVFTLFGDYLLERERPVWTGSLITLLGQLGMSPMAVRTALSRMSRKGWLAGSRRGNRSWYALAARGRRLLSEGRERIYHPPEGSAWDGQWTLVTYTVPESRRRVRDRLRSRLTWLGMGPVASGVWITPHDVRGAVEEIAAALRLTRHVEVFRGQHLGFTDTAALVRQCWDLDALNRRYGAFHERWRGDLDACRRCALRGGRGAPNEPCSSPADCFRRRFLLVHEYRELVGNDPFLPPSLLPSDWKGRESAALFQSYHEVLTGPAVRYVEEVCRAGEPEHTPPVRQSRDPHSTRA